jgi:hypothetical protein
MGRPDQTETGGVNLYEVPLGQSTTLVGVVEGLVPDLFAPGGGVEIVGGGIDHPLRRHGNQNRS